MLIFTAFERRRRSSRLDTRTIDTFLWRLNLVIRIVTGIVLRTLLGLRVGYRLIIGARHNIRAEEGLRGGYSGFSVSEFSGRSRWVLQRFIVVAGTRTYWTALSRSHLRH